MRFSLFGSAQSSSENLGAGIHPQAVARAVSAPVRTENQILQY